MEDHKPLNTIILLHISPPIQVDRQIGAETERQLKSKRNWEKNISCLYKAVHACIYAYNIYLPYFCMTLPNPTPLVAYCIGWSYINTQLPQCCLPWSPGILLYPGKQGYCWFMDHTCLKHDLFSFFFFFHEKQQQLTLTNTASPLGHWFNAATSRSPAWYPMECGIESQSSQESSYFWWFILQIEGKTQCKPES